MDARCDGCGTLYHLSPVHAGLAYRCCLCRHEMRVPAVAPAGAQGSMFLVCAFCREGFAVSASDGDGVVRCPHCDKVVDLGEDGETLVVGATFLDAELVTTGLELGNQPASPPPQEKGDEPAGGRTLGGYRLFSTIGCTPLGMLYQGEQVALRRKVAVYVLHKNLAADAKCLEVFLAQARRAAALVHPNIARVYDVDTDGEVHYMVSELVKGDALEALIHARSFLDPQTVGQVGAQAARALAAAHEQGVLHYGFSPANLFVDQRQETRVLHFGITRALFAGRAAQEQLAQMRQERCLLAPEQFAGQVQDPRVDLYGLGVTLYAGLTGSYPYTLAELEQVRRGRHTPRPPNLEHIVPDMPPVLSRIIGRLIQLHPAGRPGTAAEVAVELEAYVRGADTSPEAAAHAASGLRLAPPAKRRYKRFRIDMGVEIQPVELSEEFRRSTLAKLENVSENGAFVLSERPLPVGTFVNLEFSLEGSGTRVRVLGLVRWVDDQPGNVGMGVQFLEVSTPDRNHLNRYVDKRTALETVQGLAVTGLHKSVLRYLAQHWGEDVSLARMMQGTGASRVLFDRVLKDFAEAGLVEVLPGGFCRCLTPEAEALRTAIDQWLRSSRR